MRGLRYACVVAKIRRGGDVFTARCDWLGKTEVYLHLIARAVELGKTAIVLVLEISLTPLMTKRFVSRFGTRVAILHSAPRWANATTSGGASKTARWMVVGARSAVFAPLSNIGVIILDEEHEATYKSESSPRYHACDGGISGTTARCGDVIGVGDAVGRELITAQAGDYRLIEMETRVGAQKLPTVYVVDMRQELENGNRSMFSDMLAHELLDNMEHGEQSILFLNRRGFSTFVSCRSCGFVAKCPHCNISLTYHRATNRLTCHYCGYTHENYKTSPTVAVYIKYFGAGTRSWRTSLRAGSRA